MDKQWKHPGRQYVPARRKQHTLRWVLWGIVAFIVLVNAIIWGIYRDRTYPGTKVMGTTIGSVAYDNLSESVKNAKVLPDSLTLTYDDKKATVTLADLGITQDAARTSASAEDHKLLIPVTNFFTQPELDAPIRFERATYMAKIAELATTFSGEAVDAHLTLKDGAVTITPAKDKYRLDNTRLQGFITDALDAGTSAVTVPVKTTPAAVTTANLDTKKQDLEGQFNTKLTLTYNGAAKQVPRGDIIDWYIPAGDTYAPSIDRIVVYLNSLGKASGGYTKDNQIIATDIQKALKDKKPLSTTLTSVTPAKKFTYCTAVKGVAAGELPVLRSKLESTYGDSRGWSLNGRAMYTHATSGCDFTVWLAASNLMPSFGAICDSMWSCRVGPNVVINYDRWQNASPAWQKYGGTIEEYRYMVINHETGHWLGYGHDFCPGPGQQAPVMQQQSIDLQGCVFSPWPNTSEKAALPGKQSF
jgi:hypothetical protein